MGSLCLVLTEASDTVMLRQGCGNSSIEPVRYTGIHADQKWFSLVSELDDLDEH